MREKNLEKMFEKKDERKIDKQKEVKVSDRDFLKFDLTC